MQLLGATFPQSTRSYLRFDATETRPSDSKLNAIIPVESL